MAIFYLPIIKYTDGEWTREMLLQEKDAKQSLLDDMWSGQVEDVSCIWRLNTAYGQIDDVTQEFAGALGEMSIDKQDAPHRELRKWLDLRGVEYWQDNCDAFTGRRGFDPDPTAVRTGSTSGYQAVHVAAHTGAARILLCGFDYRHTGGEKHWHGDHVAGLRNTDPDLWPTWISHFESLRDQLPAGCEVINCTPGSAITAFRRMDLETALAESTEPATP